MQVLSRYDLDGSGYLDIAEFCTLVNELLAFKKEKLPSQAAAALNYLY